MIFIVTRLFASALPCQRLACGASHVNPVCMTERDDWQALIGFSHGWIAKITGSVLLGWRCLKHCSNGYYNEMKSQMQGESKISEAVLLIKNNERSSHLQCQRCRISRRLYCNSKYLVLFFCLTVSFSSSKSTRVYSFSKVDPLSFLPRPFLFLISWLRIP